MIQEKALSFETKAKRSAKKVKKYIDFRKVERKNRTLSLNDHYYMELQDYCRQNRLTVSQVIDELILQFIEAK